MNELPDVGRSGHCHVWCVNTCGDADRRFWVIVRPFISANGKNWTATLTRLRESRFSCVVSLSNSSAYKSTGEGMELLLIFP